MSSVSSNDPIENPTKPITLVRGLDILKNLGKAGLIPPDTVRAIIDIPADGIVKIHVTSIPYDELLKFGTSFGSVLDGAEIVSHDVDIRTNALLKQMKK